MTKPNIIFLIVDTLRYDRLGISGYRPAITPNLDRLATEGMNCPSHFAAGCNTQIAFPTMFTSTLPFDFGGYNEGIRHRPVSFPEVLRDNGYDTFGLVTGHPACAHFGYDRGFREYIDLIDLYQWFRSIFRTMLRELFDRWKAGQLSDEEMFSALREKYDRCLADSESFIAGLVAHKMKIRGRQPDALLAEVRAERELLRRDPRAICEKLIELDQDYQFFLGEAEVTEAMRRKIAHRARRAAWFNRRVALVSRRRAFEAPVVNRMFGEYLARRDRGQPFFAFLHYFDLHEAKILLSNHSLRNLAQFPLALARALRGRKRGQGGWLYDITLAMVDREVGRLMRLLERQGVAKDTIIVITGDHGIDSGPPYRGISGDFSRLFYEEHMHVPFIVHGPGVAAEEIDGLVSHLDLAPTILDLAGLDSPQSFKGMPLGRRRAEPQPFIWNENAGSGRCDMAEKPLFFAVRTKRYKSIFESENFVAREREFYDLAADGKELNNLTETAVAKDLRAEHLGLVQARLDELRASLGV